MRRRLSRDEMIVTENLCEVWPRQSPIANNQRGSLNCIRVGRVSISGHMGLYSSTRRCEVVRPDVDEQVLQNELGQLAHADASDTTYLSRSKPPHPQVVVALKEIADSWSLLEYLGQANDGAGQSCKRATQ